MRFNVCQEGRILIDGHNINQIKVTDLRKNIALVPQRNIVFSGSISEAIRFGRTASDVEIKKAAELANAISFIEDLPRGFDTHLEERGTNLSGGQLQRISIARAVLGNPSILLLDEATSALDAESELAVQLGIKRAMSGRTVIVIAHRLATVQGADEIILLEDGLITDKGSHDELIAKDGRYKNLCSHQLIRTKSI